MDGISGVTYAAVNRHDEARDPAGLFAREEEDGFTQHSGQQPGFSLVSSAHGVRLTESHVPPGALLLHEVLVDPGLPHVVRHAPASRHWGVHHAGADAVDADVFLAVVCCHGARHLNDGALGGGIQETWVSAEH